MRAAPGLLLALIVVVLLAACSGETDEAPSAAQPESDCDKLAEEQAQAEAARAAATNDDERDHWLDVMIEIQSRGADCALEEKIADDELLWEDEAGDTTTEPESTSEPDPDSSFATACDLTLNSDFDEILAGGPVGWFVADAEVRNTGNVGIVVQVTGRFKQAGSRALTMRKNARVPYDERKNVHFKLPVQQQVASAFQSAPGYFEGRACSVGARITDSFGNPH